MGVIWDSMGFNGVSHGAPNVVEEAPGVQSHQPVMIGGNKEASSTI